MTWKNRNCVPAASLIRYRYGPNNVNAADSLPDESTLEDNDPISVIPSKMLTIEPAWQGSAARHNPINIGMQEMRVFKKLTLTWRRASSPRPPHPPPAAPSTRRPLPSRA